MIVCVCLRVSDRTIERCARAGQAFEDIQVDLGVATQCGKCECTVRNIWSECRSTGPLAHLRNETDIASAHAMLSAGAGAQFGVAD
jgi:bacterioferritin-associated ferredoxin